MGITDAIVHLGDVPIGTRSAQATTHQPRHACEVGESGLEISDSGCGVFYRVADCITS